MRAVGGQEVPDTVGGGGLQTQVIGKGHDASATIAAHHAAAAVGVVEFHDEIVAIGQPQDHQAVGAVFSAQCRDGLRAAEGLHTALTSVQDYKVVSGSGELV